MRVSLPFLLAFSVLPTLASAQDTFTTQPYRWHSVQMIGTGFVDGIIFHPTAPGVCYARTDIGGAYRWNPDGKRWMPIMDWVSFKDVNLMGVESIALDPQDPSRVYMACGTYTNAGTPNGEILRSRDKGHTFLQTVVPFKMGGNENGRGDGERLSVDPHDGRILFFGTRQAGLWRSTDRAATWQKVDSFPTPIVTRGRFPSAGIVVTGFDPRRGERGKPTRNVYVAVSQAGGPAIYQSRDGGLTWSALAGQPTGLVPIHMVWDGRDSFLISYGSSAGPSGMRAGEVVKYNVDSNTWTDITPQKGAFGYVGLSVQAGQPDTFIVATFGHPGGEQIFRTLDGGKTWKAIIGGPETYDRSGAPYTNHVGIHWLFALAIDPTNPNHALFSTGYGGHETFNLTDADHGKPVRWSIMAKGIEEAVGLSLYSPVKGAELISAIGDYGGFVHWNLTTPYDNYMNPHFGNTGGVSGGDMAPEVVVRVGTPSAGPGQPRSSIGYSLDDGKTWQPAPTSPTGFSYGQIAVSADGKNWVWSTPMGVAQSSDWGVSWTQCKGLPTRAHVVADRVDPSRFYDVDVAAGKIYLSFDGGVTYIDEPLDLNGSAPVRDRMDSRGGQNQVYPTPGVAGDLWLATFDGLYHSSNAGFRWRHLPQVTEIHAFGFGAPAPGAKAPALYLVGVVDGTYGIFRSDDSAQSWVHINDSNHQYALILQVSGDPKKYGRVYVGIHGRGVIYGDPE